MLKRICSLSLCVFLLLSLTGCKSELKASEYVQANLNLTFQGEIQEARAFIDATPSELEMIYENGIEAFVEGYLTNSVDSESSYTDLYAYLVKEIFLSMRYQVGESVKIDRDTYEVIVEYQPVDVFERFVKSLGLISIELENKWNAGYYEGAEAEQEMLIEYLESSYAALGQAYLYMEYGETERFIFQVTRGEDNMPKLGEEEMNQFIERILALDKL